jgi:hypothetical protein
VRPARGSDIAKILVYLAASLLLGAVFAPWLYSAGKGLAEITAGKQTNAFVAWLAGACGRTRFPRYFNCSVMLAAAILFPPLFQWLKVGKSRARFRDTPWSLRLPDSVVACDDGQPLRKNPHGPQDAGVGFLIAVTPFVLFGAALVAMGWFHWETAGQSALASETWKAIGSSLREGIIPLAIVIATGFAVHALTRSHEQCQDKA